MLLIMRKDGTITECYMAAQRFVIPEAVKLDRINAGHLVKMAKKFKATVTIKCCGKTANGKCVKDLVTLGAQCGVVISVMAQGRDAFEVLDAMERLLASAFQEKDGASPLKEAAKGCAARWA